MPLPRITPDLENLPSFLQRIITSSMSQSSSQSVVVRPWRLQNYQAVNCVTCIKPSGGSLNIRNSDSHTPRILFRRNKCSSEAAFEVLKWEAVSAPGKMSCSSASWMQHSIVWGHCRRKAGSQNRKQGGAGMLHPQTHSQTAASAATAVQGLKQVAWHRWQIPAQ